ncbi:diguanylate cyclase domain-containing protein [Cupriavidus sp. 30B13]|uniref:sensor domain-containing diguanylate cyclase n=1 Tax=Cupriavidus sp. 30B13 TaxID=3384241 RepID=UPI003CFA1C60
MTRREAAPPRAARRFRRGRMVWSLRTKITLLTGAVALVLCSCVALASMSYAYRDLRNTLQRQQDSVVRIVAEQTDHLIEERIAVLMHIAPQLDGLMGLPQGELAAFVKQRLPVPATFNDFFIATAQGMLTYSSLPNRRVPYSILDREYFARVSRTLQPVVSEPIHSRSNGAAGVLVVAPVLGKDHALQGALGGWLNLQESNFLVEIGHNRLGETGFYCLVSSHDRVYIQHPLPSMVMRRPALPAPREDCGLGARTSGIEFLDPVQPVVSRWQLSTTGWTLLAVTPAAEAFSTLREMQRRLVALSAGALLLAALLIWLAVHWLLRPLTVLHYVVRASADDPAAYARLDAGGRDEIAGLAREFRQLMSAVQAGGDRIRQNEARLRTVADNLPMVVAFVDTAERYTFVNAAFMRLHGLAEEAILGRTAGQILGAATYARIAPFLHQAMAGKTVTFEIESLESELRFLEIRYQPERNLADGTVLGVHIYAQDITARKLEAIELAHISQRDHLTQLYNRRGFENRLRSAMARTRVTDEPMALLFIDLDRFKDVNDNHGHHAGDRLLQDFSRRLQQCVRKSDTVARLGGDEFAAILEGIGHAKNAAAVAITILEATSATYRLDGGPQLNVRASIGVAVYFGEPADETALMRAADEQLYRAKEQGRARFSIAGAAGAAAASALARPAF